MTKMCTNRTTQWGQRKPQSHTEQTLPPLHQQSQKHLLGPLQIPQSMDDGSIPCPLWMEHISSRLHAQNHVTGIQRMQIPPCPKKANRINTRLAQLEQPMVVSPLKNSLALINLAPSMTKPNPPKKTPSSKSKTSGKRIWTATDPAGPTPHDENTTAIPIATILRELDRPQT
jgi:hypothetical protein